MAEYTAPNYGVRLATPAEVAIQKAFDRDYLAYKAGKRYATSYDGWLRQNAAKYSAYVPLRNQVLRNNLGFTQSQVDTYRKRRSPEYQAQLKAQQIAVDAAGAARAKKAADEKAARYAALCKAFVMPPLDELSHQTLTYMTTTIGRNVEEPASEKREMRAILARKAKAIKLHALGLGPVPAGGMPTSGPTLYWSPELAYKREVCGSAALTPAENAKAKELGNKTSAMLHDRAKKKKRKKLLTIAAIATAAFAGPAIFAAVKGAAGAGAVAKGGAAAAKIKTATAVTKAATIAKGGAVAGKIATVGKFTTAAQAAAKLASKQTIAKQAATAVAKKTLVDRAQTLIPKIVDGVNQTRTVVAIAKGEIPPPPISLEGDSFTEWGMSLAKQKLEKEMGEKMNEAQEAEARAYMESIQNRAAQTLPPNYVGQAPQQIDIRVQRAQETQAINDGQDRNTLLIAAAVGVPLLLLAMG